MTSRIDWENNQHFVPHPPVSCKMIFEEQVHKFLTDGISLPRSGYCFWLDEANIQLIWNSAQVCSDAWSVRNFHTNSSDIILWGNHIQVQNERKNVRFHKLWHLKGCYNGNDNEKRKVRVEQAKQQLCMSTTLFWYISLPSLRDYVKIMPYFLVHGGHKQAITKDIHE